MKFIPFWIRISLLNLIIPFGSYLAWACVDYDPCDSYDPLFMPQSISTKNADPFYYDPYAQFNECNPDIDNREEWDEDSLNTEAWKRYCENKASTKDIHFLLTHIQQTVGSLQTFIRNGKMLYPDSFQNNSFLRWISNQKDKQTASYLLFASQCETISMFQADIWNPVPIDTPFLISRIQLARTNSEQNIPVDLKTRYLFQTIRLLFYQGEYTSCITSCEQFLKGQSLVHEALRRRVLSYRSGCFFRVGRYAEACYGFSLLFDSAANVQKRIGDYNGFTWALSNTGLQEIISLCKNAHQQATVYALNGLGHEQIYDLRTLRKVYELDPRHELLEVLMARELSKAEGALIAYDARVNEFYTWYCSQFPKQALVVNYTVFKKAYRQFIERPDPYLAPAIWFLRMAKDAKVKQPALFYTAAAHLCFLNDQPTGCDSILQFTRGMEMNESLRNQIRILKLCNQIHQTEKLEAETENNLLADFQWLDTIRKQKPFYQVVYRTIQRRLMYSQYLRQGDTLKALLVQMKSEQLQVSSDYSYGEGTSKFGLIYWESSGQFLNDEMSLNQCLALEQWFSHPVSAYDRWLCSEVSLTEAMLDELIARKFVQEGRFAEAVSYFHRAGDQIRVPDPFVVHILDLQDGYYEDSLHTYTLSALADTLHTLQGLQGQSLRASFDLGCALYSISYYGKCWYLQKFYRSGYEPAAYIRPSGKSLFFNLVESFRCFEKVYRQSVDPEMKSKALWMMAKIAQKNFPEPGSRKEKSTDTEQVPDYTTWAIRMNPYLDSFNRQFKGTAWYEKVYQECSYLRSFIQH